MTENSSNQNKPNRWKNFLLPIAITIASVYALQFLLDFIIRIFLVQDDITAALKPFQNHYLSFSPYFVTTEGMISEFTNDTTGAARFFGGVIVPLLGFIGVFIILYFIKPFRLYLNRIFQIGFITLVIVVFYKALFVAPKEAFFNLEKKELTVIKHTSLISSMSATLKFSEIEKIEFEFMNDYDGYTMQTIVYCQLFIVAGGKQFLITENEVDSFGGHNKNWQPTEEQKSTAQKAVEALNKLIERK